MLELLVDPFLGSANHTADYVEAPGKLPRLVIESVREFAKPEYGVDLLKLESPLAANSLPARVGGAASYAAQEEFDAIGEICDEHDIPWVLLSGGAAHDKFERVLEYAYAAGAGGFLAGRTIWLDAVRTHFSGSRRGIGGAEQGKRDHPEQPFQVDEGAGALVAAEFSEI